MLYPGDCESIVKPNPGLSRYLLVCPGLPRVSFETSLELPASLEPRILDSLRLNSPELDPDPDPGPDRMKVPNMSSADFEEMMETERAEVQREIAEFQLRTKEHERQPVTL